MCGEILAVGILYRILHIQALARRSPRLGVAYLFGTHEQHVLDAMGQALEVEGIAEASHIDVDRRTSLVGVRIVNQERLELVGQPNDAIRSVVELWSLQMVGEALDRAHGAGGASTGGARRGNGEVARAGCGRAGEQR